MAEADSDDDRRVLWRRLAWVGLVFVAIAPVVLRFAWWSESSSAAGAKPVTIQYMAWGNPQQLETERVVIQRFNDLCAKKEKALRVELFMPPAGGYRQKLLMMLVSGKAPDVFRVDHFDFASMAAKGYYKDLTEIAAADPSFHVEDFHPSAMRENYFHGRLYGLNMLLGGMICYYNQTMFKSAGLADPYILWREGRWTWAEFVDVATRLTTRDAAGRPSTYGTTLGSIPPAANSWALWLWREKGDYISGDHSRCLLDSPESIRGFADLRGMVYTLGVSPAPAGSDSAGFAFESGNIGMTFDWAGNTPRYRDSIRDFDWDIAPTPSDPGNSYTLGKGNQIVISEQCEHPKEAWEWVKYLTSKETEEYFYGDEYRRCVPTRLAVLRSPEYLQAVRPPFHIDVFVDVLNRARELPIDETWPTWTATAQRYVEVLFINPAADLNQTMSKCARAVDIDLASEQDRFRRYGQER